MFRLYTTLGGYEYLDHSYDERGIVDTMIGYHDKFKMYDYLIVRRINNGDEVWARTRTEEEFKQYLQDFKLRQETCMELKEYITKDIKVPRK